MRADTITGMTLGRVDARGKLVAEVYYGATAHVRATKIGTVWWFRIRLGKKRMLTCDCGGTVVDRPLELTYDDSWGGCSHIVALYRGSVTTDRKAYEQGRIDAYRVSASREGLAGIPRHPMFVRLTQLGERMFFWRWTAHSL